MNTHDPRSWFELFQTFIQSHLPKLQATTDVLLPAGLAIAFGLLLVFRGAGMARLAIAAAGASVGGLLGCQVASMANAPLWIGGIFGGLIFGGIAHKTWRLWFIVACLALAVLIAAGSQLDRNAMLQNFAAPAVADGATQPDRTEAFKRIANDIQTQVKELWSRAQTQLQQLGPRGAILPLAAAVLAFLAAWWASKAVAAILVGLTGSLLTVAAATVATCAEWPQQRDSLSGHPEYMLYTVLGLWVIGLFSQARRAVGLKRAARRAPAEPIE